MKSICIYCGSRMGAQPIYAELAQRMGEAIAKRGLTLIYGGGHLGLMGTVADAALQAGGKVIGCIPKILYGKEQAHLNLTELHVVESMHERKAKMEQLSDAFIAMPGGFGTFEEFCEILTWSQIGIHRKPFGLLNVANYYDGLLTFLDHATHEGFIRPEHRALVLNNPDPDVLLEQILNYQPATDAPLLDKSEIRIEKSEL